jgi:octaprenyl-diphosphate synthase
MNEIKKKIFAAVKDDLDGIEAALRDNLGAQLDIVSQTASHILFSGGKRLRPLLMVLSARVCGYTGNQDKMFSTVFEYLHVASLLHDDLVDGAHLRRGKPVAHSLYGNAIAVLVGDFLLARSLSIGVKTGKLEIIDVISEITENMTQGEIQQLIRKGNIELTESEYLQVITRKTALLIQGACRVGALISDADEWALNALSEYGYHLGIAFQIADDLLDYTSDPDTLGKDVGTDLKEGKMTLPLIHALEKAEPGDQQKMKSIIRDKNISTQDFKQLLLLMNKYNGIDYSWQKASQHVSRAKAAISVFTPSQTLDILMFIADYSMNRKK